MEAVQENQVVYQQDVFDLKKQTGEKFVPKFIKDHDLDTLKNKYKNLVERSKSKNGKSVIISICSEKGGAGKSTIACCVSQLLANMGFAVLLIDTDNIRSSSTVMEARKTLLSEYISESQEEGVSEEEVVEVKNNLDPIVDSRGIHPNAFSSSVLSDLAQKCEYDFIVVDTAGRKDEQQANFDLKKLHQHDVPNITTAYLSNAIILPMKPTILEMTAMVPNYIPLHQFITGLHLSKKAVLNTQYRILPSMTERDGSGNRELENFKEELGFNFYDVGIRRSDKIASTVSDKTIDTLFTTKVAGGVIKSFIEVADQLADDIENSLN